jgi:hypothetical protein
MKAPQEEPENNSKSIDSAIRECENQIKAHKAYSLIMLGLLVAVLVALWFSFQRVDDAVRTVLFPGNREIDEQAVSELTRKLNYFPFIFLAIFISIFAILTAIYRFHLIEITRNEQMKLGFWRIRIAANNDEPGFQTEVRRALTHDTFYFQRKDQRTVKGSEVESPLPGHPASDLATDVVNRILELLANALRKPKE